MTYLLSEATIRETKSRIQAITGMLEDEDDEQLKLDALEGETSLNEIVVLLLNENEKDEGVVAALKGQAEQRLTRAKRHADRIDARRSLIADLFSIAKLTKLTLPEATLSLRSLPPKIKVSDPDALPEEYLKAEWKPDPDKIKLIDITGELPPGIIKTNGGQSLTVRRA